MARALALDLGTKRIGVAASDATRTLASPVTVLERRGSRAADHKAIVAIIEEYEADVVVVGLPLSLSGKESHASRLIRGEVAEFESSLPVPVVLYDERFTTAAAHASLMERKMKADARRRVVDKVAAAVLLQNWLDAQAHAKNQEQAREQAREQALNPSTDLATSPGRIDEALATFLAQPVQPRSPRK